MHMALMNYFYFVIIDDHFDCSLSWWSGNNE
jgi:hypothetical protein